MWKSGIVTSPQEDFIMFLDLDQDEAQIDGSVTVEFQEDEEDEMSTDQFPIISGSYNPPELNITIESDADNKDEESFSCIVANANEMECELPLGDQTLTAELTKQ